MAVPCSGGELFFYKESNQFIKTAITYDLNEQLQISDFVYCEFFHDQDMLDIVDYHTYTLDAFNERFENKIELIKELKEEDNKKRSGLFKEAIELSKRGDPLAFEFLETYYRKVFKIRIEKEGYCSSAIPLSKNEIIDAGIMGLRKAIDEIDENGGKHDIVIKQNGEREMISAIKKSTRKKK